MACILFQPRFLSRGLPIVSRYSTLRHKLPLYKGGTTLCRGLASIPASSVSHWFFTSNFRANRSAGIPHEGGESASETWENKFITKELVNEVSRIEGVPFIPPVPATQIEYPPLPLTDYRPARALTPRRLINVYAQLSKARLTTLVVLTAMAGVALSPLQASVTVLLSTALGTTLCAASANTFNQLLEEPFDAQMVRTRNRPLVRRAITPHHAVGFALITGTLGPAVLYALVNPLTAAIGAANILLYAGVYTQLKRRTVWNTWVGAVVGALPPLMGWAACGGHLLPSSSHPIQTFLPPFLSDLPPSFPFEVVDNPLSALALFSFLFSWQFPHFNALAHITRSSYAQAGYYMLSVIDPQKNAIVSLRHSALLLAICSILTPLSGLTTWTFALTSLPPNLILLRAAFNFAWNPTDTTARVVWRHSLWYLPVLLGLMMLHKQGMEWLRWMGIHVEEKEDERILENP